MSEPIEPTPEELEEFPPADDVEAIDVGEPAEDQWAENETPYDGNEPEQDVAAEDEVPQP